MAGLVAMSESAELVEAPTINPAHETLPNVSDFLLCGENRRPSSRGVQPMRKNTPLVMIVIVICLLAVHRVCAQNYEHKENSELVIGLNDAAESSEWDPWEPFNEKLFWFNARSIIYF